MTVHDVGTTQPLGEAADSVAPVYEIARPVGAGTRVRIRVRLERALDSSTPVVAAIRKGLGAAWEYRPARLEADGHHATFTTRRFGFVTLFALDIDTLREVFEREYVGRIRGAGDPTVRAPTCLEERAARRHGYRVVLGAGSSFYSCFGIENGVGVLKLVNRHPFPAVVEHGALRIASNSNGSVTNGVVRRDRDTDVLSGRGGTIVIEAGLPSAAAEVVSIQSQRARENRIAMRSLVIALFSTLHRVDATLGQKPGELTAKVIERGKPGCAQSLTVFLDSWKPQIGCVSLDDVFGSGAGVAWTLIRTKEVVDFLRSAATATIVQAVGAPYRAYLLRTGDNGRGSLSRRARRFVVSPGRVGPLRTGMTVQQARRAGLARRVLDDCDPYWELTNTALSGSFEMNDPDDIDRIDIDGARYHTAAGIGVGSTLADVRRAYGSRLSSVPVDPEDGYPAPLALTTTTGSIIFHLDPDSDEPVTTNTAVSYMSVIPPATGALAIEDLAFIPDSDPC